LDHLRSRRVPPSRPEKLALSPGDLRSDHRSDRPSESRLTPEVVLCAATRMILGPCTDCAARFRLGLANSWSLVGDPFRSAAISSRRSGGVGYRATLHSLDE
jgi:hypothetical protein